MLSGFRTQQASLLDKINSTDISNPNGVTELKQVIESARLKLKPIDFWLRYFEPIAYKKINGPLPVEWENEVFEKYEPAYKREGAGLSLAEIYLDQKHPSKDSVASLIRASIKAINTFTADSITRQLDTFDHFFLCNRLYLLNLAAIYTTGFECPNNQNILPELKAMLAGVKTIYTAYDLSFPATPLSSDFLALYDRTIDFVAHQPSAYEQFDHFTFIKDYINPLFAINQKLITRYGVMSNNFNDYTLTNTATSIFDKSLYTPQNTRGIYSLIDDTAVLSEIKAVGKMLFYDPILSGNNARSCVSCHKPKEYFTDTSFATSLQFNRTERLPRNTPSLINVIYNHLIMLDGKLFSLQSQGKVVMKNPIEMGGDEKDILRKVLSCKDYKKAFKKFLSYTPEEHEITFDHIISAVTLYYRGFSDYYSPFDDAMDHNRPVARETIDGFNLFMGKARCATCHYVPQFNGVPPPYIGSEFEVIGVPADTNYTRISDDKGRYFVNPAPETMHAFRTATVRNAEHTMPYMHNGVFRSINDVISFYDAGGGGGRNLSVPNQTLPTDSLKLTVSEKNELISFIHSLNEAIIFEDPPAKLPSSSVKELNQRKVGGEY